MKFKKTISIILLILGMGALGGAFYIKHEVVQGEQKISKAQKQVNQGDAIFSLSPATKELSKGLFGGAQKQIDEGKELIAHYQNLAFWLQIGGAVLMVGGLSMLIFVRSKR